MASGGGNKQRSADPKTDDPSIISSSQTGTNYNQRSQPSPHSGGTRQRTPRQMPQQQRTPQNHRTPTSNEKRRHDRWEVPQGNVQNSPLAKDLFGAQNNPAPFQFGFEVNESYQGRSQYRHQGHGGNQGGYYGNRRYRKNNQGPPKHEGQGSSSQGSKVAHGQRNGPISKDLNQSTKVTSKSGSSSQNISDSDRQVQYFETLMRNGEKSENLKITVTSQPENVKKPQKEEKTTEKASGSVKPKDGHQQSPAQAPQKASASKEGKESTHNDHKATEATARPSPMPSDLQIKKQHEAQDASENTEKPEKKKKKRNRDKKKNKIKHTEEKHETPKTDSRPVSQASDNSVEKTQSTSANITPDQPDSKSPEVKDEPEKKGKAEKPSPTTPQPEVSKKIEQMGLEQAEKRLEKDLIFRLEKPSVNFPDAKYFCRMCSHHLNTIAHAHKHIKEKKHKRESKAKQQDELLRQLETPPAAALAALDRQLVKVIDENMMTEDGAKERQAVVDRLDALVRKELKGCSVVCYGSSMTTIGLKSSDVNVDVQYEGKLKTPAVLMSLLEILKNSAEYSDVQEDFDAKVPRIEIRDIHTDIKCILSIGNVKALHTTRLLMLYTRIEPTLIKLSMLYRLWGHFCQVDKQQEGSLPPHSFVLMTIFYLQQKHGMPVLHEVMLAHDIDNILEDPEREREVLKFEDGDLWYYPTAPPADAEKDESQDAEDENDADETADFADSDYEASDIIFSESPRKETSTPISEKGSPKPLIPVKLGKCFSNSEKRPNLAEQWLGLLKYYSAQYDMENSVITIRSSGRVSRSERGWSHRRIAVEDPCSPKWNLCKPMNSQALFNYFLTRLKHSVFYFYTAHHSIKKNQEKKKNDKKTSVSHTTPTTIDSFVDGILRSVYEEFKGQSSKSVNHDKSLRKNGNGITDPLSKLSGSVINNIITDLGALEVVEDEVKYDSCYKFTKDSLMDGKVPVVVCSVCKKEGHRKKNCPEEVEIKVKPLPPTTNKLKKLLDVVCKGCFELYVPKEEEVYLREKVCSDLLEYLKKNYDPKVRMCLFGSSRNRFTFRGSDLDICMTFEGNETGEDLDYAEVIENLAKVLRKDSNLRQIIPITTAKVPIVKFYHPKANLEGDISLYNLLAQRNTSMLALYASIDDRCRILGYVMKAFVKRCCIGDASRGSLSSYAYILLVIYFLQQRDPPVLPVLQELYTGDEMPEVIVDGWNSWFYDSIGSLDKVWPEFGKNRESWGELWLGMLRFYTEKFDFGRHVVCIRQKKLLTAFEKEWTSKCICIEDPFDLSHNLGAGVSRKMTNFILKVFVKARERFGMEPNQGEMNRHMDVREYFFNAEFLMDGQEVPNDRCCRICGKIGHFLKDCPKRRQRKKNGDDSKTREIECFGCGQKGHMKKDCPEAKLVRGSPIKDFHHPLLPMMIPPQTMMIPSQLMHNMGQRSPAVVQAKRQGPMPQRFTEQQPPFRLRQPAQNTSQKEVRPSQHPTTKKERQTPRKELNQSKPPSGQKKNSGNAMAATSPQPMPGPSAPHPSSRTNGAQRQNSNRNLNEEFESEPRPRTIDTQPLPRPSASDPTSSRRQLHGNTPSPGTALTVKEIESQMLERMRPDDQRRNLNHLIPRQTSNEDMRPNSSPGFPGYPNFPRSPSYPTQLGMHPMYPGYMPRYSTSPQNHFFRPPYDYPQQRGNNEGLSRTPPSPMGFMPPRMSPPNFPAYPLQRPQNAMSFDPTMGPNMVSSITFVNSKKGGNREVFYTPPNRSYPPDKPNIGAPRSLPNQRK